MRSILVMTLLSTILAGCESTPTLSSWVRSQGYQYHTGYTDEDILGWEVTFDTQTDDNGNTYRTNFSPKPNTVFSYTHDIAGVAEQTFHSEKTLKLSGSSAINFLNSGLPADVELNTSDVNSINFDIKEGRVRRMLQIFPKRMVGHGERISKYVINRELRAGTLSIEQFDKKENQLRTGFDFSHNQRTGKIGVKYADNTKSQISGADILIGYNYEFIELIGTRAPRRYSLGEFEYLYAGDAYIRVDGIQLSDSGRYEAAIVVVNNGAELENSQNSTTTVYTGTGITQTIPDPQRNPIFTSIRRADDVTPTYITDAEHVAVRSGTRLGTPGSHKDIVTFILIENVSEAGVTFQATDIQIVRPN